MTPDSALVRAFKAGDEDAFGKLYVRRLPRLRRWCSVILKSEAEGADAAQDAMILAYDAIKRGLFREEAEFLTWLLRIGRNRCFDIRRCRSFGRDRRFALASNPRAVKVRTGRAAEGRRWDDSTERTVSLDAIQGHRWIPDVYSLTPMEILIAAENACQIDAAMRYLSPALSSAVEGLLDGESYEAIAAKLDVPIGTVKSRINRGKDGMRRFLRRPVRAVRVDPILAAAEPAPHAPILRAHDAPIWASVYHMGTRRRETRAGRRDDGAAQESGR